jgi:polyphenol oxidase
MVATIGPSIEQKSYEVDAEFHARFVSESADNARFFIPSDRADFYRFALKQYVAHRLAGAGIEPVNVLAEDTCLDENRFFSFRRATLRKESAYGRQMSAIMIEQ